MKRIAIFALSILILAQAYAFSEAEAQSVMASNSQRHIALNLLHVQNQELDYKIFRKSTRRFSRKFQAQ